jgi:hypothetical protein
VVKRAGVPGLSAGAFLGQSSASPETDVDLLDLSVTSPDRGIAVKLANVYARQFI